MTQLFLARLPKKGLDALHQPASGQLAHDCSREVMLAEQAACVEAAIDWTLTAEVEACTFRSAKQKANCHPVRPRALFR